MTLVNTYTGKKVRFNTVNPEDISIVDIARALSRMCRYTGHTKEFYSVAQHCVIIADTLSIISKKDALAGLLHEAPEAYGMSDIHGTFKRSLGNTARKKIKDFEAKIFKALGYETGHLPELVDWADSMLLVDEMKQLFDTDKTPSLDFKDNVKYGDCTGFGIEIKPMSPNQAFQAFLNAYERYK